MNRRLLALAIAIACLALAARLLPGPRTVDDAFITFRYARNLLNGHGFVYNPGERVLGTTTPLYTLLMAGLGAGVGGSEAPFPSIAMVVNALADALTCLTLFWIGARLGSWPAGAGTALVWAIAPFSVTFAIGGLETSLYVFLLCGMMATYLAGKTVLTAFLASLALLTRPDALILIGPLVLDRIYLSLQGASAGRVDPGAQWRGRIETQRALHEKAPPWSRYSLAACTLSGTEGPALLDRRRLTFSQPYIAECVALILPYLAWGIFAIGYFGTPLPHSITAKSLAYRLPPSAAAVRLLQHYATPFLGHLTFGTAWIGIGLILYPSLFLIGARKAYQETHRVWPFFLYPWLYFAVFAIANPLIFRWYLTPPLPFLYLAILLGIDRLVRYGAPLISTRSTNYAPLVVILLPIALSIRGWTTHPDHGLDRPAPEMAWYQLELLYRQVADRLAPHLNQFTTLAASDVGVLGYYTSARILDTVGLNSPEALAYYPVDPDLYVINLATPPDLIVEKKPDYVVLLEVYGREGLFKDSRFKQTYQLLSELPTDIYTSEGMLVFARAESP